MSKNLFITGTGTDVGKTYVTGLIIKKLREQGLNAAYFKAAMSGNQRADDGSLIPGDAVNVKKLSGISQPTAEMCPYVYENAYSPHLAAKIEGNPVEMSVVKTAFAEVCQKYDYVTAEGSGGIICPIAYNPPQSKIQLEDIIKELKTPCLIVADAGLGTINSVVLTVEYMRNRHIPIKGIIFNNWNPDSVMEQDNLQMCQYLTGEKVIACVPEGVKNLDIDPQVLISLYE